MKKLFVLIAVFLLFFAVNRVSAQTNTWNGSFNKYWANAGNWSLGHIPTAAEDVVITSAGNQPVTIDFYNQTCHDLTINSGTLVIEDTWDLNLTGGANIYSAMQMNASSRFTVLGYISWRTGSTFTSSSNSVIEITGNWGFLAGSAVNMGQCSVTFTGAGHSSITSGSSASSFGALIHNKSAGADLFIADNSYQTLRINGNLTINTGRKLYGNGNITTILAGDLINSGDFYFTTGTVSMEKSSGTQSLQVNSGDYFNSLKINGGATVTLNNNLYIHENLTIQSGIFNPANFTVNVIGDWINTAGPDHFTEGSGRVVFYMIINKSTGSGVYDHICSNSENFNILEVNNPYGYLVVNNASAVVTCNQYDYTAGGVSVEAGTFTALDLADNAIYGYFGLQTGGTINLTNTGSFVDLSGYLSITGGTFNVYGGNDQSYWPYNNNAGISMSGGTLNFANQGIRVHSGSYSLTSNITGGTIKSARGFTNYRSDFSPTGGTIEMVGATDGDLYCISTSAFYALKINKSLSDGSMSVNNGNPTFNRETGDPLPDAPAAGIVNLTSAITINSHFVLSGGTFNTNNYTIHAKGNWTNSVGQTAFNEGTGRVIFDGGNYHQYCNSEVFNLIELNKASGGSLKINGGPVTCNEYDWTAGAVDASGTFTAAALSDNGVAGDFYVYTGGVINLGNGVGNTDLKGNLFVYGGTVNINSGMVSQWPGSGNASIIMNAGQINVYPYGIILVNNPPYTFATSITGGTIKTQGSIENHRSDFTLTGGVVEMYGALNATLSMYTGSLWGLTINKAAANTASLGLDATVNGPLTIQSGTFKFTNKTLLTGDHINVNDGGTLWLENASQLKLTGNKALWVNQGGQLKAIGLSASRPVITRNGTTSNHEFHMNGSISARYAIFEYNYGINVGGIIDPMNSFDQCTFQNGVDRFLYINNSQELIVRNANFPTAGLYQNIWKPNNAGRVTFKDATGVFAGAAFELDPYNRVDWSATQPGLWTGILSTDWHTAGNWDDLVVPTASTNVTIPAGVTNMPVVGSSTAYCNNLTLNGTLTIPDKTVEVAGSLNISGTLAMNNYLGKIRVQGDISWNSGSAAAITANAYIEVFGNWTFTSGSNAILTNGSLSFEGSVSKSIFTHSATSSFGDVYINKYGGASATFDATSTQPMRTKGFYVSMGSHFISNSSQDIRVSGNFYSFSFTEMNAGAVVFQGANQLIIPHQDAYMNHVIFNQSGTFTINQTNTNIMTVKGDLTINSGIFSPETSIIKVAKSWFNNSGTAAFAEGASRIIFNGSVPQFCTTEQFNILEIDKPAQYLYDQMGATIRCQVYDWTQGGMWIASSGSSFYASDLADDGIFGEFVLWSNPIQLHQDASQSINLRGSLSINSGGEFKVYGGNDESRWGTYGNASLEMTGGTLDFVDHGIAITDAYPFSFTSSITGGTIRTSGSFVSQSPGFNPSAGIVEFYGASNSAMLSAMGSSFYNVIVNKPGDFYTRLTVWPSVVKNSLTITEGMAEVSYGQVLECWNTLEVQEGGWMAVTSGTLSMKYLSSVNVNNNGRFSSFGYPGALCHIKGITPLDYYTFSILGGGALEATHTIFETLPVQGLYLAPGALVSPYYSLTGCEFRNSESGASALITLDNDEVVVIRDAFFPANTWGGTYNARKNMNSGHVYFINATGPFSGFGFENDPYNRIDWIASLTATATAMPQVICAGSTAQLEANPTGGLAPYTYMWSPSDGLSDPGISDPVASPLTTTNYSVTITDALGQMVVSGVSLTVNPVLPVSVSIVASSNPASPGSQVTFNATPVNGGYTPGYQWKVNGIDVGTGLASYMYFPQYGDQVSCVMTSGLPCTTGSPAVSNTITMIMVAAYTDVSGDILAGEDTCYNATAAITVPVAPAAFAIYPDGSATFIAGYRISYLPGTTVHPGGYMHGYITTSNEYCGSLPPAMVAVVTGENDLDSPLLPANGSFSVFPNPTTGAFTLKNIGELTDLKVRVELYTLQGEIIMSSTYENEKNHEFRLHDVPSGLYLIKVITADLVESFKLIVR
jgi:hypothetical protein